MSSTGSERSLASYVPAAVLRDIEQHRGQESEPRAEQHDGAILIVDITGFTPITASAVQQGRTELLSRSLNTYLGSLFDIIAKYGGDVSKVVGDGVISVWNAVDGDVSGAARRAAACALAIREQAGEYEEADLRLSIKIGLCAGRFASLHVGGVGGHWLYLIIGPAVSALTRIEEHLVSGDVVAGPEAWALISERFVGEKLDGGNVRLRSTGQATDAGAPTNVVMDGADDTAVRAYIPPVLLARLDAGQREWLAETRSTTVIFANVRGLLTDSVDSLASLDAIAKAGQRVAAHYDAWLKELTVDDKGLTLGLVLGVPPNTHEDDASRAIAAALELQTEIAKLGLASRIGVTSGPTFCGLVGNDHRRDFAMLGSHVNLAARLMVAASDDTVLCDTPTHDAADARYAFERLPAYVLKGLSTPTDVYVALSAGSPSDGTTRMIDRTEAQALGIAAFDALRAGQGGLLVVDGEPGIGKSRLTSEWLRQAAKLGISTFVGHTSEIEMSTPYHAWRPIFERLFGLESEGGRTSRAAVLRARVEAAGADPDLTPLLSSALLLDLPDDELTAQMSGEVRADNTRDLLIALITSAVAERPAALVIEDAHWLDWASGQLARDLQRAVPSILLIMTTRPVAAGEENLHDLLDGATSTVHLLPLSRDDAVELAAQRSGASVVADAVAALVDERAEGNPLFIEQLTYSMRDSGQIVVEKGVLRGRSDQELRRSQIPDSVQRVITSRLDQLPPEQALTIKVASVIGTRFAIRTLTEIHPLSPDPQVLATQLEHLSRVGLVEPVAPSPEPTFQFGHKITQEVAYNLMPVAQLRQLHGRLAEWYEQTYADDLSPFHALLAYHWRRADVPERAIDHLEIAGYEALRTFANEEAVSFFDGALSLMTEANLEIAPSRLGRWHISLGEAYVNMSRYRSGREQLEQGLRLLRRGPSATQSLLVMSLLGQLARQLMHRIGLHRPRSLSDEERDELVAVCRAYERLAEASYYEGSSLLPLYSSIRILNEAETSQSAPEIARGLSGTGALFGVVPLPRVAESYLRRALIALGDVDDATTQEIVRVVVGFYYAGAADWEMSREQFLVARRTASRISDRRRLLDAVENLLEIDCLRGSFGGAIELADELIAAARSRRDRRFEADALVARTYAALQLGRFEAAARSLDAVREIMIEDSDLPIELRIKTEGVAGFAALAMNDDPAAVAAADAALRLTKGRRATYFAAFYGYMGPAEVCLSEWEAEVAAHGVTAATQKRADDALKALKAFAGVFPIGRPRLHILVGRRHWLLGHKNDAVRSWRRAADLAQQLSMPFEVALAELEIGRHAATGTDEREAHLQHALELFNSLGAAPRAETARTLLAAR